MKSKSTKKDIKKVEGLVVFVSQTRANIGPGAQFRPKIRTGGEALTFYCAHIMWLAVEKRITSGGEKRAKVELGSDVECRCTKNKLTGKKRNAYFPIFYDYGVDDITSNVFFLMACGHWPKEKNSIIVPEWNFKGMPSKFVKLAEAEGLQEDIKRIVGEQWREKEKTYELNRPGRFD